MKKDPFLATTLGNIIEEKRCDQGLTQAQLAELAGVSRGTVTTVLAGDGCSVSLGNVAAILNALNIQIDMVPARDMAATHMAPSDASRDKAYQAYQDKVRARTKVFRDKVAAKMRESKQ